jgi:CO/xanthine dehydrogenase Mo-binding subunit
MLTISTRRDLLSRTGCLTIIRQPIPPVKPAPGQPGSGSSYVQDSPEIFIAITDDGPILAFNGHVDLGTGIRTSLAQIVAEELDADFDQVHMVLGHSDEVPNQGPTIASASIQISAQPLRRAAAQARLMLVQLAAERFQCDPSDISTRSAGTSAPAGRHLTYAQLLAGQRYSLTLDLDTPLKDPAHYRIIGHSHARVDIPAKATGSLTFVHDMRVPGMLHGRVVRPPYHGHDHGPFVGHSLISADTAPVEAMRGVRAVVIIGDFIGVVAEREEQAIQAAKRLKVQWRPVTVPDLSDPARAIKAAPAAPRLLQESGDIDAARQQPGVETIERDYCWPYQMHASIGPSCAVADYQETRLKVWAGTQNPQSLRHDLAKLMGRDEGCVEIIRMEASGCYGRNCADDVAGDALLLSRAVGAPVRVQLSRQDEHLWEPKGTGQVMQVRASFNAAGDTVGYDFTTRYPSNDAPLLASLLTGVIPATANVFGMGDRTAVSPYGFENTRFVCDDLAPLIRSSWIRGVSALPNSFAHDALIDEIAGLVGADPLAFRLRHLTDERAKDLLKAVAVRAGWKTSPAHRTRVDDAADADDDNPHAPGRKVKGRGISYARYVHSRFPGFGAAWSAWVVDIEVDRLTGDIRVERVTVGQDTGTMINPDGVRHQIQGNVIQTLSRTLKERVRFDAGVVASREWSSYPVLTFPEVPPIDVVLMPRQGEPPLGAGESASVPGPAALANALYDALGIRFYAPPFTPDVIRAALKASLAIH